MGGRGRAAGRSGGSPPRPRPGGRGPTPRGLAPTHPTLAPDMFNSKPSCTVNELLEAYNAGLAAQEQQQGGGGGGGVDQQLGGGADGAGGASGRRRRVTVKQLLAALYQLTDVASVRGMVVTARRAGAAGGGDV
jgi:hypothetical protein